MTDVTLDFVGDGGRLALRAALRAEAAAAGLEGAISVGVTAAAVSAELAHKWAQQPSGEVDPTNHPGEKSAYQYAHEAGTYAGEAAGIVDARFATIESATNLTSTSAGNRTALIDGKIVATPKRLVAEDDFSIAPGDNAFPLDVGGQDYIFGAWSAAHRGLPEVLPGEQNYLAEIELPAGFRTLGSAAKYTVALMRPDPATGLPLVAGQTVAVNPVQVIAEWDLSAFPAQVLPSLRAYVAVPYEAGDLIVGYGKQVEVVYGTGPDSANTYSLGLPTQYAADPENPAGVGFAVGVQTGSKPFAYKAKLAAGNVRSGLGGPASYAVIDEDGRVGGVDALEQEIADIRTGFTGLNEDFGDLSQFVFDNIDGAIVGPKGDTQISDLPAGSSFTAGSNVVTVADAVFTSADIGKVVYCTTGGVGVTQPILPVGTITQLLSSTSVRTSTTWTEDFATPSTYDFLWGTDDTVALEAVGARARGTGEIVLPPGQYMTRRAFIDWQGMKYPLSMRCAGRRETVFHIPPNFDFSSVPNASSNMLYKATNGAPIKGGEFVGFGIRGPRTLFVGRGNICALILQWADVRADGLSITQLNNIKTLLQIDTPVRPLNDLYLANSFGTTNGLVSYAGVYGHGVTTSNCGGKGTWLLNSDAVATTEQTPFGFVNSLFDECGGSAVLVENSREVTFTNSTMFGSGARNSPGLELKGVSTVNLIGSAVSGYGNQTPRDSAKVGVGGILRVTAGSRIVLGGDPATPGVTLQNAGTVIVDGTSKITGPITGTAPIRQFPGTALPAALPADGTASNAAIAAKINAIHALLVATGTAS